MERVQDGLYTSYRTTVFGELTLLDSVDQLIRGKQVLEEMNDSLSS